MASVSPGSALLTVLFATARVRRIGTENYLRHRRIGEAVIFVFWHAHLLPLVHVHRREGIVVLVSTHADGEFIARVIAKRGFGVVRGSSTREGARGLRRMVKAGRAGADLAVTPDGPTGPRGTFKPGVLLAAKLSGLPVVPIVVHASRAWTARSWDRFMVPRPFARVQIEYLPSKRVPRNADRRDLERIAAEIADELHNADPCTSGT